MLKAVLVALLVVVAVAAPAPGASDEIDDKKARPMFEGFMKQYNRNYSTEAETELRYAIFKDNLARAAQLQKRSPLATFGVTKFSDLTPEEFRAFYLGFIPSFDRPKAEVQPRRVGAAADVTSFDWRSKNAVTDVKDQGQCGSCWAFSATEEIESMWFLGNHTLPVLSPQQIVSCDTTDQGCNGGDTPTAYAYVKSAGGQDTEASYPYTSGNSGDSGKCKFKIGNVEAKVTGFTYAVPPCTDSCSKQNEDALADALVSTGPVSICVYAESWQTYVSGILSSDCPHAYDTLDHCVQLVGFDQSNDTPYWIIRNSWNTNWGIEGYIHVKRGSNLCGVADEATFATVA